MRCLQCAAGLENSDIASLCPENPTPNSIYQGQNANILCISSTSMTSPKCRPQQIDKMNGENNEVNFSAACCLLWQKCTQSIPLHSPSISSYLLFIIVTKSTHTPRKKNTFISPCLSTADFSKNSKVKMTTTDEEMTVTATTDVAQADKQHSHLIVFCRCDFYPLMQTQTNLKYSTWISSYYRLFIFR